MDTTQPPIEEEWLRERAELQKETDEQLELVLVDAPDEVDPSLSPVRAEWKRSKNDYWLKFYQQSNRRLTDKDVKELEWLININLVISTREKIKSSKQSTDNIFTISYLQRKTLDKLPEELIDNYMFVEAAEHHAAAEQQSLLRKHKRILDVIDAKEAWLWFE